MQNKIAIVLPVRNFGTKRYERLIRCLDSYLQTTEGLSDIYVLHDDNECDIYNPVLERYPFIKNLCIPSGISLMEKLNVHALEIANEYKYVGFIGDDIIFQTQWESEFINFLSSRRFALAFANENSPNAGNLAAHPFITSNMIKAVGFFGCPAVTHHYFDNYWHEMVFRVGEVKYFPNIVMEHNHATFGKDISDALFNKIESEYAENGKRYIEYKINHFEDDVRKILQYE